MIKFNLPQIIAGSWLGVCLLALIIGGVMLAFGIMRAEALPAAQVVFGTALCSAAIVGGALFLSFAYTRKLIHAEVLPAVYRLSEYMAQLNINAYQISAADMPRTGSEDRFISDAYDEILCILDGRPCRIFRDGQVDLETLAGTRRFQSVEEARLFIGSTGAARIERLL